MSGKESTPQKLHDRDRSKFYDQDKDVKIGKWREKGVDYIGKRAIKLL